MMDIWMVVVVFLVTVVSIGVWDILKDKKKNLLHIPGPIPLPFLGNALLFAKGHEFFMKTCEQLVQSYGPILRMHLGTRPNVVVTTAEAYEKILSSNQHITKGKDYRFLWPWLGTGLLTSTGAKWHSRRKMLTPAFHFRILEDFLEVMNTQSDILCDILAPLSGGAVFDIFPLVTHCALDIICETAMGKSIQAQANSDTDYVRALYLASDIIFQRQKSPWLWDDRIFAITPLGFRMRKCLRTLHGFTSEVIKERKMENDNNHEVIIEDDVGVKKRHAFMDLLLEVSEGGKILSDEDIREEVDTFMFEGHDTTATNMSFTLYLLATHPQIQRQCLEELDRIFDGDQTRPATSQDLASMKYLESCIKESLRLYQSVPIMTRTLAEDIEIDGYIIPANTNVIMGNFILHRNKDSFPDPDKFDPERFSHVNPTKRHPYSYVPFSAGPRNCIGQKFALMEEKAVISSVLRRFSLRSDVKPEDIPLLAELILRPKDGLHISIHKRIAE
eukprot:GFUD01045022.1.p1 GENE.GFUD01045022.1~~GFUD01045022.1.p1  ORF type:complete len:502 (-),score=108.75 GFUD01045022.1:66-1571(-)